MKKINKVALHGNIFLINMNKIYTLLKNKWWTFLLGIIILASLIGVFASIHYYWAQFHNAPTSNDPLIWSAFAGYISGTLNPLLLIINICITIWLTIIINKFSKVNTDRQIQSERKAIQMQLKHEALQELRIELNKNFDFWRNANNVQSLAQACLNTLINFADTYSYLFTMTNIKSYNDLSEIINEAQISISCKDFAGILQRFMQADALRIILYAEIGENVIS
ncbi:MAG: hypothetical protein WCH34_11630 [Bacteroidota bacterium]